MKWDRILKGFAVLLLPLPLLVLLGEALRPGARVEHQGSRQVSPVLDVEERTRRVTYKRNCEHSAECEAPLGCVADDRVWASYCTDSQCMTDAACPEGQVCRSVATLGEGPLVRFCVPLGTRKEGERCDDLPSTLATACGPEFLCGGRRGWCGRPCKLDMAGSCPSGFFCADVTPEPLCLPTCEVLGCPEGQQCIRTEEGVSTCAQLHGRNCQQSSCPENSECRVLDDMAAPGRVWMDCVQPCGENRPACPDDQVCYMGRCQRSCDPHLPGACGEGFHCKQLKPEKPWVCRPHW
jgi:hypothetical protein